MERVIVGVVCLVTLVAFLLALFIGVHGGLSNTEWF